MTRVPVALTALALLLVAEAANAADPGPGTKPAAPAQAGRLDPARRKAGAAATASLEANGTFVRAGEQAAFFAGALGGTLDVQDPPGDAAPLDGASLLCPGVALIDLSNQFQEAEGRCTLTTKSGDLVFADFECGGDAAKGCRGSFEISGGTGALKGIAGGSSLVIQGGVAGLAADSLGKRVEAGKAGTATWTGLSLTMP